MDKPARRSHSRKPASVGGAGVGASASTFDAGPDANSQPSAEPDSLTDFRPDTRTDPNPSPALGLPVPPAEPEAAVSVPKFPKGQSPGAVYGRKKRAEAKASETAEAPKQATETLIAVAEMLGQAAGGPPMKPEQKMLVREGLPELMRQMTPVAVARTQAVLYPGLVLLGFGTYALEVWQAVSAKAAAERAAAKDPVPRVPSSPEAAAEAAPAAMLVPVPAGMDDLKSHDGREFIAPRGY